MSIQPSDLFSATHSLFSYTYSLPRLQAVCHGRQPSYTDNNGSNALFKKQKNSFYTDLTSG